MVQITDWFNDPTTVAKNCCVPFARTWMEPGWTVTPLAGTRVTVEAPLLLLFAAEVAVITTLAGEGIFAGAV